MHNTNEAVLREAFEREAKEKTLFQDVSRTQSGCYRDDHLQDAWKLVRALALAATATVAKEGGEVKRQAEGYVSITEQAQQMGFNNAAQALEQYAAYRATMAESDRRMNDPLHKALAAQATPKPEASAEQPAGECEHYSGDLDALVREYGNAPTIGASRTRRVVMQDIYRLAGEIFGPAAPISEDTGDKRTLDQQWRLDDTRAAASRNAGVVGWLYDWTHSSATGRADEHFTSFTAKREDAFKPTNNNQRAVCLATTAPDTSAREQALQALADQGQEMEADSSSAAPSDILDAAREVWQALNDLSFDCDDVFSTRAPKREIYNQAFVVMEKHRATFTSYKADAPTVPGEPT